MDPSYMDRKIVDLSEEELTSFLGPNVAPGVRVIVDTVRAKPTYLGFVDCFAVDCLNRRYSAPAGPKDAPGSPTSPTSPTISEANTLVSQLSPRSDASTVVIPDLISEYEANFWYHGISVDPPKLMWRSDLETNPFPTPQRGDRFFKVPTKTAHGVFNTPLNNVWDTVAPLIIASMKSHRLKYSALKAVRFSTRFSTLEDEDETFGPVVVWIAVQPNTTNAGAVRDATPDILGILASANVTGIVVEWYKGSVQKLFGQLLMRVEDSTSPSFGLNHPFNTGLGIPIARQSDDAQGNITFLFREVKDGNGYPSDRILALTNKHVASVNTTTTYEFNEADPQHILVCGERRFARAVVEIEDIINKAVLDAFILTQKLEDLESTSDGQNSMAARRVRFALDDKKEGIVELKTLLTKVRSDWKAVELREFGLVDWAPEISVRVDEHHYTRDIATFAVDGTKLENFEGNIVDLGNQYDVTQLRSLFWPITAVRNDKTIPANLQLPIRSALPCRLVINPDTEDQNGEPLYIVAKYGNTTKLTLGRYSGMEAYTCTDLGLESREVAVYNHSKFSGNFSDHGDSGSLIFTGDGNGLAMLHSGMPRGLSNHVTFGTPLWWVIEQILGKYPSAEFYGIAYTLD
ncbi:hypothetical protein L202_08106 [Cryptococcus amylolentus CBS 6039]|uniref:Uncharacterized protein n=1 Tax=Cryptococcus amylolentus CBS 6039 TaxID=1295533 RepID=A0A1E3HA78_9TREE|nr:hypothetical protein L202_08106 [Cryptococcus amylolentus CBS 6039]ODN72666.1 hypothetical protein L202_08106 [Cryptococcus amylolentus CBS 6039]